MEYRISKRVKKDKKKTARRERSIGEIGGKKGKIKIRSEDREYVKGSAVTYSSAA